ncbi:bifunctional riboflavin kinase/FAD synthetase, partial [Pseudanabaenaceae cyanobacterium LEGE 13415]|nr:bifunctional riboflavin kinase/FAD synthetase [Pseudanabaenaceae cyanobacterium LEGE 13415]
MWITSSPTTALTPTAVALGNFDGIHLGHRQVITPVLDNDGQSRATVVTFNPHPKEFFSGEPRTLLTPKEEKVLYLEEIGVEQLVLLPFNRELA